MSHPLRTSDFLRPSMFDAHAPVPQPALQFSGLGTAASWLSTTLTGAINAHRTDGNDISVTVPSNLGKVAYVKAVAAEHPVITGIIVLGVIGVGVYLWRK